jgi:hypothetical protein
MANTPTPDLPGKSPIIEALKSDNHDVRITCGFRWMYYSSNMGWIVREKKPRARRSDVLIKTQNESEAVRVLVSGVEQ